jgi:sugar/nucleoside kinase (ribokinase family)
MARQRVIVGIGEALLCEYPDRVEPGGLAIQCAAHAVRLGQAGVVVSRVGQDRIADLLIAQLKAAGINTDHIQSDPDLATGRLIVRSIGGKTSRTLSPRAAFDNLQWDSDLEDVAQQADAVVFGMIGRRDSQSRSIIKRFLGECRSALRVFDITNRATDAIDRLEGRTGLEYAQGLIADATALQALAPGWNGKDARDAAIGILRGSELSFVASVESADCNRMLTVHASERSWAGKRRYPSAQHDAAVVGLIHGVASGWDFEKALDLAERTAEHAASHPTERMTL